MNLRHRHFQLLFIMLKTIKHLLFNGIFEAAFHLCSLYNNIIILTAEYMKSSSGSLMISNTYSSIVSTPKRMDITCILQLVTKCRTEACCSNLISCLLANSRADLMQYDDDDSDTSSLLVFNALTRELSQSEEFMPQQSHHHQQQQKLMQKQLKGNEASQTELLRPATVPLSKNDDPALNFFDNMTAGNGKSETHMREAADMEHGELLIELIRAEEIFMAHIIVKCLKLCPSAFELEPSEINKNEIIKLIEKASRFLWTHISSTLENYVLWWNEALPLASRPVGCAKYLREWLLTHVDAPEPVLATLKSLGEILTIHVVGCLWDKQFRRSLILANSSSPEQKFDRNSEFHCHDERVSLKAFMYTTERCCTLTREF